MVFQVMPTGRANERDDRLCIVRRRMLERAFARPLYFSSAVRSVNEVVSSFVVVDPEK